LEGNQGERNHEGFKNTSPPNPKEKGLETTTRKSPRKGSENHQKENWERQNQTFKNHAESSIHTMKVHTRSILPPNHQSLSQDVTMKLSS
jgi:hypothetical protein